MKLIVRASLISTVALSTILVSAAVTPIAHAVPSLPATPAAEAASGVVAITSSNSADVTDTATGKAELAEFASRHTDSLPTAGVRTATTLQAEYRVLQIDMSDVYSATGESSDSCDVKSETLVTPISATNIVYKANAEVEPSLSGASDACQFNVEWDEGATDQATQDDPVEATAARPYAQKYASACFSRKWHYEEEWDNLKSSWNDACYQNWVERNDGNRTWNYYTKKASSTCLGVKGRLTSCGHGVERAASGPKVSWEDWAPNASQDRNDCRSRSISVSLLNVSVGGEFDLCEKQVINKYEEAGKMSSYWKGKVTNSARGTAHQVAVKVGQNSGRPKWHHWINSDVCIGCLQG